jgi:penicillin-insensitive murein endopeptidase
VDATHGLSVGAPNFGYLLRGARLPRLGVGFETLRSDAQGGQHYGTERLVQTIARAAAAVRRRVPNGAPLRIGDLSARHGGHIPHHASHRAGRDADLLFFALDATGRSVPAPGFVRYDAAGVSMDPALPLRFDLVRNWALVEALARDDAAGVIRIFCAERLRVLLLEYGRAHARDDDTVLRADALLRQPGDSAPHDDHFHIRIACRPEERAEGCRDGGPIWWWMEQEWGKSDSAPADDETILALLDELPPPDPPLPAEGAMSQGEALPEPEEPPREAHPEARLICAPPSLAALREPPARHRATMGRDDDGVLRACTR